MVAVYTVFDLLSSVFLILYLLFEINLTRCYLTNNFAANNHTIIHLLFYVIQKKEYQYLQLL